MSQLDDRAFVLRHDPKDMYLLTIGFPDQCRRALDITKAVDLKPLAGKPSLVVLTGLGGSAAGGDFTRALFEANGTAPFMVNRDYALPSYVDGNALIFAVSYSGNTEETIAAYNDAKARGARVIVVTSGGKLAEMAKADGYDLIQVPGGQPPRTALGYLFVPVVAACEKLGLIPAQPYDAAFKLLDKCAEDWKIEVPGNPTKKLAEALHGKLGLIYGLGAWQGIVTNRWKGQINENAKTMAFPNVFPELCHNEIIGWVNAGAQGVKQWVVVTLKDGKESAKMTARAKVTLGLIASLTEQHEVLARGETLLEKLLSLTYYGDFVSLYLAALNGVDPENIDSINTLKNALANVP